MDRDLLHAPALRAAALLLLLVAPLAASAQAQVSGDDRPVVRTQADLPRYTYPLSVSSASELLTDDEAFAALASSVQADIERDLATYVIEDRATLRSYYGTLATLAVLRGDHEAALAHTERLVEAQEKPAERLMLGHYMRALVAAERAGGGQAARLAAFREAFAAGLPGLPWAVVQDAAKEMKGQAEILSPNLVVGLVQSQYDPGVAATGSVSRSVAAEVISFRSLLDREILYLPAVSEVLAAFIAEHEVEKPDIWQGRDVDLTGAPDLHPVVIGIWDTGVDPGPFGAHVLLDEAGEAVHVAFAAWTGEPTRGPLHPLTEDQAGRYPHALAQLKGFQDLQANVNSEEADALRRHLASLEPAEVQAFIEELSLFGTYSHGTHVAGIAVRGNPAARLLTVRETFPHSVIPPAPTRAFAERWAANMQEAVDFLRQHGARVVNMSWGGGPRGFEHALEANGVGESGEERQRMAAELFGILVEGMRGAMQSAPEILFIPAAGNHDADVDFDGSFPGGIALPNVLTVGAVDQAGDETSFTAYGASVRLHANGYHVESYMPGGQRMRLSGTSMAAPNAANLAGKLLAIDPSLTPEEVIELMVAGADRSEDGRRVLMNPRRSLELLAERRGR